MKEARVARKGWHIEREADTVTVSRIWPPRWDICVEAQLPVAGRLHVAHQVRQDLWRTLRHQRGFSPAVAVRREGSRLVVQAGGQVAGVHDRGRLEEQVAALLANPAHRRRWVARGGGHGVSGRGGAA